MAMKILYHPQLSMRSYDTNTWLVDKDAQFTKIIAYVKALPQEWEWYFLMPAVDQATEFDVPDNVHVIRSFWANNVLEMRYHFDMNAARNILAAFSFDVLLCEVPEHVRAWRVAQKYAGENFPIVAMVEHVDIYEQTKVSDHVRFMMRQIDGALACDRLAFPLAGMKTEWIKAAKDTVGLIALVKLQAMDIEGKMPVWNAIYSRFEVQHVAENTTHATEHLSDVPVINFISRLSDNQRTHYEEFFEACRILEKQGQEFAVWVANPNEAQEMSWCFDQCSKVTRVGTADREDYIVSLLNSDIVPILYPQDRIYSLGFCEAVTADNLVLTYDTPQWPAWQILYPFEPTPEIIADTFAQMLKCVREGDADMICAKQDDWLRHDRSVEHNIGKVRSTIEEVCREAGRIAVQ